MSVTDLVRSQVVDGVRVGPDGAVVAHSVVRSPRVGMLPLAILRDAVGELVASERGPGWRVSVHEVAALRILRTPADGDVLTTTIACQSAGADTVVASARSLLGDDDTVVSTITARLTVRRAVS